MGSEDRAPNHMVTLSCFGASKAVQTRLKNLKEHHERDRWQDILHDPYVLFDIILDELYLQVDRHICSLVSEFGKIENVSLNPGSCHLESTLRSAAPI